MNILRAFKKDNKETVLILLIAIIDGQERKLIFYTTPDFKKYQVQAREAKSIKPLNLTEWEKQKSIEKQMTPIEVQDALEVWKLRRNAVCARIGEIIADLKQKNITALEDLRSKRALMAA